MEGNRFQHHAMGTIFVIDFGSDEVEDREAIVEEAWQELEALDAQLSSYRYASDVSILNSVQKPKSVFVGSRTIECLEAAIRYHRQTVGAFDVTLGPVIRVWKEVGARKGIAPGDLAEAAALVGMDGFEIDRPKVKVLRAGMQLDLGGIGKGFALDRLAKLLQENGVRRALLGCGGSTLLALGEGEWPLELADGPKKVVLKRGALSTSANPHLHIIDPATYHPAVSTYAFVMVKAPTATQADALSTAFMVLPEESIRQICKLDPKLGARLYKSAEAKPVTIGENLH